MAVDTAKLRGLYKKNPTARALLDYFAGRTNNATETKVDRILHILKKDSNDVSRNEIIEVFRALEELECGNFVTGRKGWPSRFVWGPSLVAVGKAASGENQDLETAAAKSPTEEETDTLRHTFYLRPDLPVDFVLPEDLTVREAVRLAKFVESIPFGEEED